MTVMRPSEQLQALGGFGPAFRDKLGLPGGLTALSLGVFQVNVGRRCNQSCTHCHVDASPLRTEEMSRETLDICLDVIRRTPSFTTVDVTGGAPELNPHFKYFVSEVVRLGRHVIDRCNLTIFEEPGFDWLPEFLFENRVEVIASLPHFSQTTTDRQRGGGVFHSSMRGLKRLNDLGYGKAGGLPLNLVYNPSGLFLSAPQRDLEREFKEKLRADFGIEFNSLYCINNMPINRFLESLHRKGRLGDYLETLVNAFNPGTVNGLMCRHQVSVGWDGSLYDCDFNQMLEMETAPVGHIREFDAERFLGRKIRLHNHCFGCTAGAGSSCGGELA